MVGFGTLNQELVLRVCKTAATLLVFCSMAGCGPKATAHSPNPEELAPVPTISTAAREAARPGFEGDCAAGQAHACLDLGMLLLQEPIEPGAFPQAAQALVRGCELHNADACERAATLSLAGLGLPQDNTVALRYFEATCSLRKTPECRHPLAVGGIGAPAACTKDSDCALTQDLDCTGPCGSCPPYATLHAVEARWLAEMTDRCMEPIRSRQEDGLPMPTCLACPATPYAPPAYKPAHALCRAGRCLAI